MRKLQLDLDAIHVESFDTSAGAGDTGTVLGAEITADCEPVLTPPTIAFPCGSNRLTCGTCLQTCKATCDDPTCAYESCFQSGCATCLMTCNPSCNWGCNP